MPSTRMPQVSDEPALIAVNFSSSGGNAAPLRFSPQQAAVPSARSPQVWSEPVVIVVNRSSSGGHSRP